MVPVHKFVPLVIECLGEILKREILRVLNLKSICRLKNYFSSLNLNLLNASEPPFGMDKDFHSLPLIILPNSTI